MLERIKAFYNKENSDYSTGMVDPYKFHTTFYLFLKAFQVLDNEPIPKWTYVTQTFMIVTGTTSMGLAFLSTYHGVVTLNIHHVTEAGTYFIVLTYELLIISCSKLNLSRYHSLLRTMRKDFEYICTEGIQYRERFFQNQLLTYKASIWSVIFTFSVSIFMVVFAFLALAFFLAFHSPEDEGSRPLLLPFWVFDVDFGKSPVYEITFIYSNICIMAYAYNYIFMLQTQIVWVRHITTKADLVIWSLQDLLIDVHPAHTEEEKKYYDNLIRFRMADIVFKHQSMNQLLGDYAAVYKKLLMFEQKLCGPVVCLTAYCSAEKLDAGEFHAILILLCIATIVMVFIPSFLCTILAEKLNSVCDACWSTPMWNVKGSVIRPYLILIMQRSLRSLPLQAAGFEDVSIQTFSNKMTSAYSFFNMLRQSNL